MSRLLAPSVSDSLGQQRGVRTWDNVTRTHRSELGVPGLEPGRNVHSTRFYVHDILATKGSDSMTTATKRTHKHFQLDSAKIKRAQRALRARTETEAIERALDFAIAEHEKNRLVLQATERFIKSGIEIKDVYGTLVG